jgi:hypothetical protein
VIDAAAAKLSGGTNAPATLQKASAPADTGERLRVPLKEQPVVKRSPGIVGLATLAALAVPIAFSAYRLARPRNYTQTREFKALAGGYLI